VLIESGIIGSGAQDVRAGADSVFVPGYSPDAIATDDCPGAAVVAPRTGARAGDRGAILITSLLKFVVIVAIVGVIGLDAISLTTTQVRLHSAVQEAAQVGHDAYANSHSSPTTVQQVDLYAKRHGYTVPANGIVIAADGTVTVTLAAKAQTIAAHYLSALNKYVDPQATATATNSTY
jgi:Tfp pilus assembly protein PilX